MEWLSNIFKLDKLPTKIVFWLFLFSFALLLMPEKATQFLRIQLVVQNYGMYIGLVCSGSGIFLCVKFLVFVWQKVKVSGIDAKKKIDKLVAEWNEIIDSENHFKTVTYTAEEPTDPNSFEALIGATGLYRQVQVYSFHQGCSHMLSFEKLKTRTIAEIESMLNYKPELKNYFKKIEDVRLVGDFRSKSELIEYAKNQMTFIRDILIEIRNTI